MRREINADKTIMDQVGKQQLNWLGGWMATDCPEIY